MYLNNWEINHVLRKKYSYNGLSYFIIILYNMLFFFLIFASIHTNVVTNTHRHTTYTHPTPKYSPIVLKKIKNKQKTP